jgi:alpha-galactosidase
MGKQTLKYRTDVAMMGKLGYDIEVQNMNEDEIKFSQEAVANYKRISDIIWFGDLYRLISPYEENRAVLMYVNESKSKSVLFSYNLQNRRENFNPVLLQGLDSDKNYKVEEINLFPGFRTSCPGSGKIFSGDYLMKAGLIVSNNRSLTSAVIEITEVK